MRRSMFLLGSTFALLACQTVPPGGAGPAASGFTLTASAAQASVDRAVQANVPGARTASVARRVSGALTTEDVPETPPALAARLGRYLAARRADVAGFDPVGGGLFILTRFGDATQLHRVDRPLGARHQLTFEREPIDEALPSRRKDAPGVLLAYDRGGDEQTQLFWLDARTRTSTLWTDGRSRNNSPLWSPDGTRLAYSSTRRNGRDFDVWVLDRARPTQPQLVLEAQGLFSPLDWSPDGQRLLVLESISETRKRLRVLVPGQGLGAIDPVDDPAKEVAFGAAAFSADGGSVFYVSDAGGERRGLWVRDVDSGRDRALFQDPRWDVETMVASPDRRMLALVVNEGGWSRLQLFDTAASKLLPTPRLPRALLSNLVFSPDGGRLAFTLESGRTPGDAYVLTLKTGGLERWTESEVGGLDPGAFHEYELVSMRSFDGLEVPAFVLRAESSRPTPVVVIIHGGPEAQSRPRFTPYLEYLVRELGYTVVLPNVRGSTGYGRTYTLLDNGAKRMDSVQDIGAVLDWIKAQPGLDAGRVGILGGSYGGFMVLATGYQYPDRVKAIVDVVGISNFVTFLESTSPYRRDLRRVEYGDERDPALRELLTRISPTENAARIQAPLFVVQGANDPRVPRREAEQIVEVVRRQGRPVWFMIAANEGHGYQRRENRDAYLEAAMLFLETHLRR